MSSKTQSNAGDAVICGEKMKHIHQFNRFLDTANDNYNRIIPYLSNGGTEWCPPSHNVCGPRVTLKMPTCDSHSCCEHQVKVSIKNSVCVALFTMIMQQQDEHQARGDSVQWMPVRVILVIFLFEIVNYGYRDEFRGAGLGCSPPHSSLRAFFKVLFLFLFW